MNTREKGEGGYTKQLADGTFDPASWVSGFDAYNTYFATVAAALTPCGAAAPVLAGPGWGNVNTLDKPLLNKFVGSNKCVLQEVAMHYYVSWGSGFRVGSDMRLRGSGRVAALWCCSAGAG